MIRKGLILPAAMLAFGLIAMPISAKPVNDRCSAYATDYANSHAQPQTQDWIEAYDDALNYCNGQASDRPDMSNAYQAWIDAYCGGGGTCLTSW